MEEFEFIDIAKKAKVASKKMANISSKIKNTALLKVAEFLDANSEKIFEANLKDLKLAEEMLKEGRITQSAFNRLKLDKNKLRDMLQGIVDISELEDPVGKILMQRSLDTGLILTKKTCLSNPKNW